MPNTMTVSSQRHCYARLTARFTPRIYNNTYNTKSKSG